MSTSHVIGREAFPRAAGYPGSHSPVHAEPEARRQDEGEQLATLLGWLSIGLGITSLAAPRSVARAIGARGEGSDEAILRLIGVQELACGFSILNSRRPVGSLWARVAGDAMHLTMLGGALIAGPRRPDRMAVATAAIAGITAVDAYCALQLSRESAESDEPASSRRPLEVYQAITIRRPAEDLYRFWRDLENLPTIMNDLESVQVTGDRTSHWKAKAPAGRSVEWDAELTDDQPNQRIAWRSTGGHVETSGSVRFVPAPGGRGTEVHVQMRYNPPGGVLGQWVAKLFGEAPEQQVYDELRHFKQVMEVGEVVLSDASDDGSYMLQRPGQPPESARR